MLVKKEKINILNKSIEKLGKILEEGNFVELTYILGNKKQIIIRNFIAGIGFTVITAILIIVLQKIVTLNIPVIGEYIADIVEIVQRSI